MAFKYNKKLKNNLPMEDAHSELLAHIMETLNLKADLCDTYDNLCDEIEDVLYSENRDGEYGNVRKAIQKALNVAQSGRRKMASNVR